MYAIKKNQISRPANANNAKAVKTIPVHKINIKQLLDDVNNTIGSNNELSKDVNLKYNNSNRKSDFQGLKFSLGNSINNIEGDRLDEVNKIENSKFSLETNINRMNENAELKDRVAGWYGLEKRTVKKIIDLEQDTYKGTDLNNLVQEAAKEAL